MDDEMMVREVETHAGSFGRAFVAGGLLGGVLLGTLGHGVASGWLAVAGLGQWAVAGPAAGAFTGFGVGVAVGGLTAALVSLYRLPARTPAGEPS